MTEWLNEWQRKKQEMKKHKKLWYEWYFLSFSYCEKGKMKVLLINYNKICYNGKLFCFFFYFSFFLEVFIIFSLVVSSFLSLWCCCCKFSIFFVLLLLIWWNLQVMLMNIFLLSFFFVQRRIERWRKFQLCCSFILKTFAGRFQRKKNSKENLNGLRFRYTHSSLSFEKFMNSFCIKYLNFNLKFPNRKTKQNIKKKFINFHNRRKIRSFFGCNNRLAVLISPFFSLSYLLQI